MAFLEWRRFNFFDVIPNVDQSKISECLKDKTIECASSGCGYIVLGDNDGNIHVVNRFFEVKTFRAFLVRVCLVEQAKHAPILVTIGDDEAGVNPHLKVWKLDKIDKNGVPMCVRMCRAIPGHNPVPATVLCVHENLNLMAVGYSDGSIVLHRGDISRERSVKKSVLQEDRPGITGLAFRSTAKLTYLYACTNSSVFVFDVSVKDKESKVELDRFGCQKNCSTLADSTHNSHFMIGVDTAVYCFTPDGRGPCYAIEGSKVLLQWFRKWNYLVIVSRETEDPLRAASGKAQATDGADSTAPDTHNVTILDIQNKFIVLSTSMRHVKAVLAEWGSLYVLTGQGTLSLHHLLEKDLQTKLTMLFKKNLYDVSIRIARSHQYDSDGLAEIFKQYGDHLYFKGDHSDAIEQYIKTIGRLEPSYVIRKFLDSQHIENLTTYLQALHKHGAATEDHTTLILNCYTKLDKTDKLKEFIMTKDREVDFDVEIAIKVCRQASPDDALMLAEKHRKHDWYLKIQTEDHGRFKEALQYITKLEFEEAEANMIKYGGVLLANAPEETTECLKKLCTDYEPADKSLVDKAKTIPDQADPEDFIHLFTNCPDRLQEFLEYLLQAKTKSHSVVFKTLLEHYLSSWNALEDTGAVHVSKRHNLEQAAMRLLKEADSSFSRDQLLILCQAHNFRAGIIHLLEETRMYQQIIQYHMRQQDLKSVLSCCRRHGKQDPTLWVQALWFCARDARTPSNVLEEILQVIEKEKSMPPLLVLDALCNSPDVSLATVRSYLLSVLQAENKLMQSERDEVKKYREDSQRTREQIQQIQTSAMVFQLSRCSICKHPLELPSIHFLCLHSFHQHCFQSYSENENECLTCLPNNKKIMDQVKSQEQEKNLHEAFHRQLDREEDGFTYVAKHFGKNLFNRVTVPEVLPKKYAASPSTAVHSLADRQSKPAPVREPGQRLGESSSLIPSASPKLTRNTVAAASPAYSQSVPTAVASTRRAVPADIKPLQVEKKVISAVDAPKEGGYDEAKNPFSEEITASEDSGDPLSEGNGNPFGDDFSDTEYDPSLNPFSE